MKLARFSQPVTWSSGDGNVRCGAQSKHSTLYSQLLLGLRKNLMYEKSCVSVMVPSERVENGNFFTGRWISFFSRIGKDTREFETHARRGYVWDMRTYTRDIGWVVNTSVSGDEKNSFFRIRLKYGKMHIF